MLENTYLTYTHKKAGIEEKKNKKDIKKITEWQT